MARKVHSVLYLYKGLSRTSLLHDIECGRAPTTALRGYEWLVNDSSFVVDFLDSSDALPKILRKVVPQFFLEFLLVPKLLSYDFVIASDFIPLLAVTSVLGRPFKRGRVLYAALNAAVLIERSRNNLVRRQILIWLWSTYYRFVCIAESQRAILVANGLPERSLFHVPYGIDADFFASVRYKSEGSYIVSIGRDLGRDYKTFLRAVEGLPYPVIIATTRKNIPKGIHIPGNVEIRYDVTIDDVRELYRDARFSCISLVGETSLEGSDCTGQTVMMEALSAGQPVIVTDRKWIAEYFESGLEYRGVPAGDADALRLAIQELWNDTELRSELSKSARVAVRKYNAKRMSEGFAVLLNND